MTPLDTTVVSSSPHTFSFLSTTSCGQGSVVHPCKHLTSLQVRLFICSKMRSSPYLSKQQMLRGAETSSTGPVLIQSMDRRHRTPTPMHVGLIAGEHVPVHASDGLPCQQDLHPHHLQRTEGPAQGCDREEVCQQPAVWQASQGELPPPNLIVKGGPEPCPALQCTFDQQDSGEQQVGPVSLSDSLWCSLTGRCTKQPSRRAASGHDRLQIRDCFKIHRRVRGGLCMC